MTNLRAKIIRLAKEKPEYRDVLLPLLKEAAANHEGKEFATRRSLERYMQKHPKSNRSKHKVRGEKDVSDQPGFQSLQGLSPDQQRSRMEKAKAWLKKEEEKDVKKQVSKRDTDRDVQKTVDEKLKGMSPEQRKKILQKALADNS